MNTYAIEIYDELEFKKQFPTQHLNIINYLQKFPQTNFCQALDLDKSGKDLVVCYLDANNEDRSINFEFDSNGNIKGKPRFEED